jgi:hypothetical protein
MRERAAWVRDDRGLSLLEVAMASGLFMVLLLAALSMLDSGTRVERTQQARHDALLELRSAMTRVSTDVRQAVVVRPESTTSRLTIETLRPGDAHWTVFELSGDELVKRSCSALPCTGTATPLASRVTSAPFCYDPPSCVSTTPTGPVSTIRISLTVQPEVSSATDMTLATDVQLRNV